jgi:hypothetical protein
MTQHAIDSAIDRGLDFLEHRQLPSGAFELRVAMINPDTDPVPDGVLFATPLVAESLSHIEDGRSGRMIDRAAAFLLAQMEPFGSWRFWNKGERGHFSCPPDVDDMACASNVLRSRGILIPDNLPLFLANRDRRGCFYSWLLPRWPLPRSLRHAIVAFRSWLHLPGLLYFLKRTQASLNDVDGVVNANVIFYLRDHAIAAPVVEHLIEIFRQGREADCDKWYRSGLEYHYFVSRAFSAGCQALGAIRDEAVGRIVSHVNPDGRIGSNTLETALAICALLSWGTAPPAIGPAVNYLVSTQRADGSWPRFVAFTGGPRIDIGWGSEELSTGFCLEALARARRIHGSPIPLVADTLRA